MDVSAVLLDIFEHYQDRRRHFCQSLSRESRGRDSMQHEVSDITNNYSQLSSEAQRDLQLAIQLNQDLESSYIYRRRDSGNLTVQFLAEQENFHIEQIMSGELQRISNVLSAESSSVSLSIEKKAEIDEAKNYLSQLAAHLDSPKVLQTLYLWAEHHREIFDSAHPAFEELLEALTTRTANVEGFLKVAPVLNDSWIGERIAENASVSTTYEDREDHALSEFVYDVFLTNQSESSRLIAARFLSQLSIEKLLPSLSRDLDNRDLPVASRCLIAEVIGNHPDHEHGAETLLKHIFPKPYDTATECFNANKGKFALNVAGGLATGVISTAFIELFLPKNPYFLTPMIIAGAIAGTCFALKRLFNSLNEPRIGNQNEEVQLAAAKGLARMISKRPGMQQDLRDGINQVLDSNMDRLNDHKMAGILRQAMQKKVEQDF